MLLGSAPPAFAKDLTVKVDARSAPWSTGANPKLRFGLADARAPKVIIDSAIIPGGLLTFKATGTTTTLIGGTPFTPVGDTAWPADRGSALFPSHYIKSKKLIYLNQLVGAFITADGRVVGEPFAIGEEATVRVPPGAAGISLGLNDDKYSDNTGALTVNIHIAQATVTVEPANDRQ
jgi:hypothetical protein